MVYRLYYLDKKLTLQKDRRYSLGRNPEADIVLEEPTVSRHHGELWYDQGRWWIIDRGSRNGTRVNGRAVQKERLCDGDRITIGSFNLVYIEQDSRGEDDEFSRLLQDTLLLEYRMARLLDEAAGGGRMREEIFGLKRLINKSRDQMHAAANVDALTGLYNRRFYDQQIRSEAQRSLRYRSPVSLIMVDIDFFKAVNDRRGHQAGDDVLRGLGGLLKDNLRAHDVPCRYGGEEFSIISPGIPGSEAGRLAEKLRRLVEGQSEAIFGFRLTVSMGVAELQAETREYHEKVIDAWVARADAALYRAKETGRNKVVIARSL